MARSFIIKKFSKILIYLKQALVIEGITHAITLMYTEPLLDRRLSPHTVTMTLGSRCRTSASSNIGFCAIMSRTFVVTRICRSEGFS